MFKEGSIEIKMLPACAGDCILISFLEEDYHILIDGGYADTYRKHLKKQLVKFAAQGKRINLLVISHIDSDHIGGILAFLKENGNAGDPNIIRVDEVWYNAFYHMNHESVNNGTIPYAEKRTLFGIVARNGKSCENGKQDISVSQGNTVAGLLTEKGYNWNTMWSGKAVCVESGRERLLTDKIKLILLNPGENELRNLADYWISYLRGKVRKFMICKNQLYNEAFESQMQQESSSNISIRKDISFSGIEIDGGQEWERLADMLCGEADMSKTNRSSIAFLLEYKGFRMLFPGDCPIHLFQEELPSKIDIVKLPHHGSEKNINADFIRNIRVSHYLLSTAGKSHGHPSKAVVANILCKAPGNPVLLKNYVVSGMEGIGELMGYKDE